MDACLETKLRSFVCLLLLSLGDFSAAKGVEVVSTGGSTPCPTNIAQIRRTVELVQSAVFPVRFEAVVCWISPSQDAIALQDESGAALFDGPPAGQNIRVGDRIVAEGNCEWDGSRFSLGRVMLVNNDGLHSMAEQSEAFFLRAGKHSIDVGWFNKEGDYGLEVSYQGSDLPKQRIPGSALSHAVADSARGVTNWEPGLLYRGYEGTWDHLPDFSQMEPVSRGTATNFDLGGRSRDVHVGLKYTGYVEVPRDGVYTFFISSDDGSQLCLDGHPFRLRVVAANSLPKPRPIVLGQGLPDGERGWSEVDGKVTFAGRTADGIRLELSAGGGHIAVELPEAPEIWPPLLLQSRIRVAGFFHSTYNFEGQRVSGRLLVPGADQLHFLALAPRRWNAYPANSIAKALSGAEQWGSTLIKLRGKVASLAGQKEMSLEDATGKMTVQMAEAVGQRPEGAIEVLGQLQRSGTNAVLLGRVWRKAEELGNGGSEQLPVLETIEQVHRLKPEEAAAKYPVHVRGVVTYVEPTGGLIQDPTRGVYVVQMSLGGSSRLEVGDYVEVGGVSGPGDFAPVIMCEQVKRLGRSNLPDPAYPTWDQLINGSMDCQYAEIEGIVAGVQTNSLILWLRGGRLQVDQEDFSPTDLAGYLNARVHIRGCVWAAWDRSTRQVKSGFIRITRPVITLDESAPADAFEVPSKRVAELLQFDALAGALQRVKVSGQILHAGRGEYCLTDGTNGLRFITREATRLDVGDQVEVVGFPQLGGLSPLLREAVARKTGEAPLPRVRPLLPETLLSCSNDAALVEVQSRLVSLRSNQTDRLLELQTGTRTFVARLERSDAAMPSLPIGCRVRLEGVYSGHRASQTTGEEVDSFELLLNSPADIQILDRPSWWNTRHTMAVVGGLTAVLLLAGTWISALRQQVNQRTRQLKAEIEGHKATEAKLAEEIGERERLENEKDRIHGELLATSRQAGMAEVAIGVLHNVGNVLNSVNITATLVADTIRRSKARSLTKVAAMLKEHEADLGAFMAQDEKGRKIPGYLNLLAEDIAHEQDGVQAELASLRTNVDHIKEIVAMQQSYARVVGVTETISVAKLVEDAIKMHSGSYSRHRVQLARDYAEVPPITVDKHKAIQVIVNLLQNAKYACDENGREDKRVTVSIQGDGPAQVKIVVADNGVGISPENLTRIFAHGFTTRKNGHGFGLHSGALAAKEMGGALQAYSEGAGLGARFELQLPIERGSVS
jgi:signal transduction histidine kinase